MSFQQFWGQLLEEKRKKQKETIVKIVPKKIETNVVEEFEKIKKERKR